MTKKPRTGLQSKISQIFFGVPIPKKAYPFKKSDMNSLPEEGNVTQVETEAAHIIKSNIEPTKLDLEQSIIQPTVKVHQEAVLLTKPQKASEKPYAEPVSLVESYKPEIEKTVLPQIIPVETQPSYKNPSVDIPRDMTFAGTPLQKPAAANMSEAEKYKKLPKQYKTVHHPISKSHQATADAAEKRQKVMLVFVIFLSILLVFLLYNPFKNSVKVAETPGTNEAAKIDLSWASGVASAVIDWPVPPDYPKDIPDPMLVSANVIKPGAASSQSDKPLLKGINVSEDKSLAIFGTDMVEVNQEIPGFPGYFVLEINPSNGTNTGNVVIEDKNGLQSTLYVGIQN
jgi:hypothetical protein